MKSRVLVLGLLSLLWIVKAEASVDEVADELGALLTRHPLTVSSSLSDQLALLKKIPECFKEEAKQLITFKEAPIAHPFPKETSDEEETDSPRSPVAVDTTSEIIYYDEKETILCITQFCFPAAASLYERGIKDLFESGKSPKHSAKDLTEMLQCLGSKMLFARAIVEKAGLEETIGTDLQITAIKQVLKFHKPTLPAQDPELWAEIPPGIPGCGNCVKFPQLPK